MCPSDVHLLIYVSKSLEFSPTKETCNFGQLFG